MLSAKAKRVRRKLRALRDLRSRTSDGSSALRSERRARGASQRPSKLADSALAITAACNAAAVGFEFCARRTRDERIAVAARSAAAFLLSLVESAIGAAAVAGIDARPRTRTCDRLRWEWLASTAMVVDGAPDGRLLAECARLLEEIDEAHASAIERLGEGIAARLRVATAEAYSLASAVQHIRRGELALALA